MRKNQFGSTQRKVGIWGAVTSGVILGAMAWSSGAAQPIKDAQTYGCTDSCYINYRWCLMQGKDGSYCATQYQTCTLNCTFGGTSAREAN